MAREVDLAGLKMDCTYIVLGPSQSGKSTFLNSIFGKEIAKVGTEMCSTTYAPSKIQYNVDAEGILKIYFIDTVGLLDTDERKDEQNIKTLHTFLDRNVTPQESLCILLFSKFMDEFTGPLTRTVTVAHKIREKYNCSIITVLTFCNSVTSGSFPAAWLERRPLEDDTGLDEASFVLHYWQLWKNEKLKLVNDSLGVTCLHMCTDFGARFPKRHNGELILLDGTPMLPALLHTLFTGGTVATLLLIKNNAKMEDAKKAAEYSLSNWAKDVFKMGTTGGISYGVINGAVCAYLMAGAATEAGVAATVPTLVGLGVGSVAGFAVAAPVLFVIGGMALGIWYGVHK